MWVVVLSTSVVLNLSGAAEANHDPNKTFQAHQLYVVGNDYYDAQKHIITRISYQQYLQYFTQSRLSITSKIHTRAWKLHIAGNWIFVKICI